MPSTKKNDTAPAAEETAAAPVAADNLTDAQIDAEAKKAGAALDKGAKIRVRIPKSELNPNDDIVPVCVNGHLYKVKRGESVEVPEVVAKILERAKYI